MDRAHRLGQTKQVTVYRLICKGTIEERILQRAREKSEVNHIKLQTINRYNVLRAYTTDCYSFEIDLPNFNLLHTQKKNR